MADLQYVKLSPQEVESRLGALDGWRVSEGMLKKDFEFKTYKDGLVFASAVGYLADAMDHHPDLIIGYKKVSVAVNTHSVGGISPYDFELARRISALG